MLFKSTRAYTGDYNQLLYLRARYYAPNVGRFITKDKWEEESNRPMSYNTWLYAYSNPATLTDPSGMWRWRNPVHPFHRWIEDYYTGNNPLNFIKQLEYTISGIGTTRHPDMFNSLTVMSGRLNLFFSKNRTSAGFRLCDGSEYCVRYRTTTKSVSRVHPIPLEWYKI